MKPTDYKLMSLTLDHLIAKYNKSASLHGFQGPSGVHIYMPKYLIDTFTLFLSEKKFDAKVKFIPMKDYKGYKLIPGLEEKIIIAHESYPETNLPHLIAEAEIPEHPGILAKMHEEKGN